MAVACRLPSTGGGSYHAMGSNLSVWAPIYLAMGSNLSCYGGSYLAGFLQLEGLPICYGLQPYFPKPERVFKKDHGQRQAIRQGGQGVGMHVLCGCGRMLVGIFLCISVGDVCGGGALGVRAMCALIRQGGQGLGKHVLCGCGRAYACGHLPVYWCVRCGGVCALWGCVCSVCGYVLVSMHVALHIDYTYIICCLNDKPYHHALDIILYPSHDQSFSSYETHKRHSTLTT